MFCPRCGNNLLGSEEFCPKCGQDLKQARSYNVSISLTKEHSKIPFWRQKKFLVFGLILLFVIIGSVCIFLFLSTKEKNLEEEFAENSSISYTMTSYTESGVPKFINGDFTDVVVTNEMDALNVLENISELGVKDAKKEFLLLSKDEANDVTYYRFQQLYENTPVYNQNVILAVGKDNHPTSFSGYYIPEILLNDTKIMSEEEMKELTLKEVGDGAEIESIEKMIYIDKDSQASYVYKVIVTSPSIAKEMLRDANDGSLIFSSNLYDQALYEYTGAGINDIEYTINLEEYFEAGTRINKYRFIDPVRNISISDCSNLGPVFSLLSSVITNNALFSSPYTLPMNNGVLYTEDTEFLKNAITTMAHYEIIYDYYKNVLNRDSYDDKGSTIYICLGVSAETFTNKDLNNAAWASAPFNRMIIGDFNGTSLSLSLDILAHEFTHGVISQTSNFSHSPKDKNQANESGALNEGYADVFGALIEGKNWIVGDANQIPDDLTRDISNPEQYGYPAMKGGEYYYPDHYLQNRSIAEFLEDNQFESLQDYDRGGEHRNSTVVGYAAYLMYHNGAFESMEEMAKVWYQSLFLLLSYSNFEDCALAIIESAESLGLSQKSLQIIQEAFYETKMLDEETFSVSGTVKSKNNILSEVEIKIYDYETNELLNTYKTDSNGSFSLDLTRGMYTITWNKDGFNEVKKNIIVNAKSTLNVEMAKEEMDKSPQTLCTTDNCHNFTIYMYEVEGNCMVEKPETFSVDDGTILSMDLLIDSLGNNFQITLEGTEANVTIGSISVPLNFYYYQTKEKYNWNTPVTEDIEIELNLGMDLDFYNTMMGCS